MKQPNLLSGLLALLAFQLAGEAITVLLDLPLPGALLGMLLLLCYLLLRGGPGQSIDIAARGVLSYLALLFVPAGVGVMAYGRDLREEWLAVTVTLVGSTLITLAATALLLRLLAGRRQEASRDR